MCVRETDRQTDRQNAKTYTSCPVHDSSITLLQVRAPYFDYAVSLKRTKDRKIQIKIRSKSRLVSSCLTNDNDMRSDVNNVDRLSSFVI